MQFQTFRWDDLGIENMNRVASLKRVMGTPDDVLLYDAIQCGLLPDQQRALGVAVRLQKPIRDVVIIGLERTRTTRTPDAYTGYQWAVELPDARRRHFIAPVYHIAMRIEGNPLELHWKWTPAEGKKIAVLNVELATSADQINEMWQQARVLHAQLRPRGGGAASTPIEIQLKATEEWYAVRGFEEKYKLAQRYSVDESTLWRWEQNVIKQGLFKPPRKA